MNPEIAKIVKALALTENGGKVDVGNSQAGKTGEMKSLFQFTPNTWKAYAKEASGNDNLPLTPENEAIVVYHKVGEWVDRGYSPKQIASMWNAGVGEPNAYEGRFSNGHPSHGVNAKYGIPFDVPGYVNKFDSYLNKIGGQNPQEQSAPMAQNSNPNPAPQVASKGKRNVRGLVGSLTPKI